MAIKQLQMRQLSLLLLSWNGLFNITDRRAHWTNGNVSETVDDNTSMKLCNFRQLAPLSMTSSNLCVVQMEILFVALVIYVRMAGKLSW